MSEGNGLEPKLGALAMQQALQVFEQGVYSSPEQVNPQELNSYAAAHGMPELAEALRQRYKL